MTEARRCWKCKEIYPLTTEYFMREQSCSTGYRSVCRNCKNARRREVRRLAKLPPPLSLAERRKQQHRASYLRWKRKQLMGVSGV